MTNKCKSPWTGIFIETNGKVKSCCAGAYYWGDLHEQSIEDIVNSEAAQKIRAELAEDLPSDYCQGCRRDEVATGYSLRNYYDQFTFDAEKFVPRNLDIRWNALCNLNCVYCNEHSSTKWQKLKGIPVELTERHYYTELLKYIAQHSNSLEILLLVGGEPLLPRQNVRLLTGIPNNTHIDIISNLSVDLNSNAVFQQIKNKTNVGWKISCETVGQRFEYVRHGAEWGQFVDNLKEIKNLPGHKITLLPVYCIYSATNMLELYSFAIEMDIQIHWQNLWGPEYQNVANFSPRVRNRAIKEIDKVLALPGLDKFDRGMNRTFLESMREQLVTASPAKHCNEEFLTWCRDYEQKYANDVMPSSAIWFELMELIRSEL